MELPVPDAELREIDVVTLLEDTPAKHEHTGAPLIIPRGQVGTIVCVFDPQVGPFPGYMVEFADRYGRAVAMPVLPAEKLLKLFFDGPGLAFPEPPPSSITDENAP